MNFIKIAPNYSFTKMRMEIQHTCNLCVIWQHNHCDMYINLYTIGLTGATELGTVTMLHVILRQIGVDFFWPSVSVAKGLVATTHAAHPRQNSSEYARPPPRDIYIYRAYDSHVGKWRHFENSIPCPDYQIHLVLDQFPYDLKTKSNIQEWHFGVILKESSHLENIWMFLQYLLQYSSILNYQNITNSSFLTNCCHFNAKSI